MWYTCEDCKGEGTVKCNTCDGIGECCRCGHECEDCDGDGDVSCETCKGVGRIEVLTPEDIALAEYHDAHGRCLQLFPEEGAP